MEYSYILKVINAQNSPLPNCFTMPIIIYVLEITYVYYFCVVEITI